MCFAQISWHEKRVIHLGKCEITVQISNSKNLFRALFYLFAKLFIYGRPDKTVVNHIF